MGSSSFGHRFAYTAALLMVLLFSSFARADQAQKTVTLTISAHSVTLSWIASTSTGVTGYAVYRSETSGGPYTKVSGATVVQSGFKDTAVVTKHTYYYVVRAVNSAGTESANSSQVSGTIP